MIVLDERDLIGEGYHRKCYFHPADTKLCIKINKKNLLKEDSRELGCYSRLEKRNIDWKSLSRYHGQVETSLGVGRIFDLIRDDNDAPSKTLEYYLTKFIPEGTITALKELERYLLAQAIITTALKPRNILLQVSSHRVTNAVIVDDIGNTELIPISSVNNFFARIKVKRKIKRFRKQMQSCGLKEI